MAHSLRLVADESENDDGKLSPSPPSLDSHIAAIRAGDRHAFASVYHTLAPDLIDFAASLLGDVLAAEDVVEDVFVELWERHETWTPTRGVRAYLFRAVRNDVVDALRRRQIQTRIHADFLSDDTMPGMSTPPVPVEHALDVAAQIDAAFRTIAQFPEARRTAMTLYWRNDLSVAEIAEVMGISQNAVYLHLNRGLHALKHLLPHSPE